MMTNSEIKKNKILLIIPTEKIECNYAVRKKAIFPIETASIASVLLKKNYNVSVLDLNIVSDSFQNSIENELISFNPDFVAVTYQMLTFNIKINLQSIIDITKQIKNFNKKIITIHCGPIASSIPEKCVEIDTIDYNLIGEVDFTLLNLLEKLNNDGASENADLKNINAIAYKKDGEIYIDRNSDKIKNLDLLPLPDREIIPVEKYFEYPETGNVRYPEKSRRFTVMQTSRGCGAKCIFCNVNFLRNTGYRHRSIESIIEELKYLILEKKIEEIHFFDENFTFNRRHSKDLLKKIIEEKLKFHWLTAAGASVYTLDDELLELMRQSGGYRLNLAIESGNQRVLDSIIKKPVKLVKAEQILKKCNKLGFEIVGFFVVGLPGETKKDLQDTVDFAENNPFDYVVFSIATPQYGTELLKICQEKNLILGGKDIDEIAKRAEPVIKTDEFTYQDLIKIRCLEWDRINFSTKERKEKICRMMGLSLDELEEIRANTKKNYSRYL